MSPGRDHPMAGGGWSVLFVAALAICACGRDDGPLIERDVEYLVDAPGPIADAAEQRLLARGPKVILYLETGLYNADENGRRRVLSVLRQLGDREALPILAHLAANDPSAEVRRDAKRAHKGLAGQSDLGSPPR